jgi:hypothetical protein
MIRIGSSCRARRPWRSAVRSTSSRDGRAPRRLEGAATEAVPGVAVTEAAQAVAVTEAAQAVDLRRGVPAGLVVAIAIGADMGETGAALDVPDHQKPDLTLPGDRDSAPRRPSRLGLDLRQLTEISHGKTPVQRNVGFAADVKGGAMRII